MWLVSVEGIVAEDGFENCGACEADFVFCVLRTPVSSITR